MSDRTLLYVTLTLFAFSIGKLINRKTGSFLANPILIAIAIVIIVLKLLQVNYSGYKQHGGDLISFFLGPAVVALGIPLYKQIRIISKNVRAIAVGIIAGCITGIITAAGVAKLLAAEGRTILTLAPKSVTTPIAMGITEKLGGIPSLTAVVVIITGILGALFAPEILRLAGVKSRLAIGLAIGTASHVIGTSRAFQIDELVGAVSGMAIGLNGITTAILAPILVKLFQ